MNFRQIIDRVEAIAADPVPSILTDRGGSVAAVAAGQRVPGSIADCDRALVLLRVLSRSGTVEEREMARLSIDHVLDRRNRLVSKRNGGL